MEILLLFGILLYFKKVSRGTILNYLAHFYYNQSEIKNISKLTSYFHFGSIFPDFIVAFNPKNRVRLKNIRNELDRKPEILAKEFYLGNLNHLEYDRLFHSSSYFRKYTNTISELLREFDFIDIEIMPWFVAHIMLEMYLDYKLLQRDSKLARNFWQQLEYCDVNKIKEIAQPIAKLPLDGFHNFYNMFVESRFVERYTSYDGIIAGLNKVMSRARMHRFTDDNFLKLELIFHKLDELVPVPYAFEEFL